MVGMDTDPCEWPVDESCLPDVSGSELAMIDMATELAIDVLWALSGRQFGACLEIVRPCPSACQSAARRGVCACGGGCLAVGPTVVRLPGPVHSVEAVRIGGDSLDQDQWRLDGDLLYRVGGVWPSQDLTRPDDDPGTWSVTYRRGVAPPEYVGRLVGVLAAEFYQACTGGKCRLPRRVQSVTRQGVSYQMVDPVSVIDQGLTGLAEVDMWIRSVNPNRLAARPKVR